MDLPSDLIDLLLAFAEEGVDLRARWGKHALCIASLFHE
jgi:hypothetical protein